MQVPKPSLLGEAVENAAKRLQLRMWPLCVSAQSLRAFMSSIMRSRSRRTVSVLIGNSCSCMRLMTSRSSRQHAGLVGRYARTNGSFCEGFRTPAVTNVFPRAAARVRKPARDETAGKGTYWAVPRAQLWGFGRGRATAEVSGEVQFGGGDRVAGRGRRVPLISGPVCR